MSPLGILGGTFDPIHYGHLRPAAEAAERLELAEVRVIPAGEPPHRARPVASARQRLRMVELAVAEFPRFVADDRELRRPGPSYTVPTLESLRAEFGATPLCLFLGADAFAQIETWHRWQQLPELAHLVVLHRPGWPVPDAAALAPWARARFTEDPRAIHDAPAGRLVFVPVRLCEASATRIRALVARGEVPPAEWLAESVWEYIRSNRIYRSEAA